MKNYLLGHNAALLAALFCAACGSGIVESQPNGAPDKFSVSLGEAGLGCPPATGNDEGVGEPCTASGGECAGTGSPYCTADLADDPPYSFCTKPCLLDAACGEDATCMTHPDRPGVRGCIPNACIE